VSRSPPRTVASVAIFVVAATSAWSTVIHAPSIRFALAAVWVAAPALLEAARALRAATAMVVVSLPGTMLLAGVPISALAPRAWPQSLGHLGAGAAQVLSPGGTPVASAWSLAAVMLASGALWMAGSSLAVAGARWRSIIAIALLVAPWLAGLSRTAPDHAAWQGAIVLVGSVLWFPCPRRAIALGAVAALLSVPLAQAVGPRARWFDTGGPTASESPFRSLYTEPTYGPLTDRRTGAPMLELAAAEPALWRMQTLDRFDGHGWTFSPDALPELPQPAAQRETTSVRVLGLRNDLVVGPGRVDRVNARGRVTQAGGEAWRIAPQPVSGDGYQLRASYVHVGANLLARDRAPLDPRSRVYTTLGFSATAPAGLRVLRLMLAPFGVRLAALEKEPPAVDERVVALARRLAAGAHTEWEVVARVERYLLEGGRFHYTTRVPEPGPRPLMEFLLQSHAGYCQQFAGAAALLLRLAGVPARVVVGFATGAETAPGRYTVRDLDAHEWIEVYFQGYGWVPFNPTPAADPASIASGLDPLRPPTLAKRDSRGLADPRGLAFLAVLGALAVAAVWIVRRHRSRRDHGRLPRSLERVAARAGGLLEPSTTLGQLGAILARIGPRTAALAAELERARFASDSPAATGLSRMRLALALVNDLGPLHALLVWAPVPRRRRARSIPPTR
jgi:protein-glutamine gamma-glutamyltransferase